MSTFKKFCVFLTVGLLASFGGAAQAALVPLFEYSFPASYDGTSTTCTDLSGAGHNATFAKTGGYVADARPDGYTSGGSISGYDKGYGLTNETNLLTNALVAADGGYTFDVWFKALAETTAQKQILSHAGTDGLMLNNGYLKAIMYYDNGSGGSTYSYLDGPKFEVDRWYHLVSRFDTTGNELDENGFIAGEWSFIVNNVVLGTKTVSRHTFSETLNRPIGINCKGQSPVSTSSVANCHLFNPEVSFGVEALPQAPRVGDANNDGFVNQQDAAILAEYWQTSGEHIWWGTGDFNGDKTVDDIDATMLAANWGATGSASVPEPSVLVALAGLLAMLLVRRKVRR